MGTFCPLHAFVGPHLCLPSCVARRASPSRSCEPLAALFPPSATDCGVGWHDTSTAVAIESEQERSLETSANARQLLWALAAGVGSLAGLTLLRPASMLMRWSLGSALMFAFFHLIDAAMRVAYACCCGVKVESIFGDLSRVNSLRSFWAHYWNRPIISLLGNGVYAPLRPIVGAPLAKLAVFIASGLGHTYALNCTGSPLWIQASVMMFFVYQVPLLWVEASTGLRGKLWVFMALASGCPLFVEPFLATGGF